MYVAEAVELVISNYFILLKDCIYSYNNLNIYVFIFLKQLFTNAHSLLLVSIEMCDF